MNDQLIALEAIGRQIVETIKAVPKTVGIVLTTMLLFTLGAAPANAATTSVGSPTVYAAEDGNPIRLLGCPSIAWISPAEATAQELTAMIGGVVLILGMFALFVSGIGIVLAGKRTDRAQGGIEGAKNVGIGLGVVFILIPIGLLVLWGVIIAINPNC